MSTVHTNQENALLGKYCLYPTSFETQLKVSDMILICTQSMANIPFIEENYDAF